MLEEIEATKSRRRRITLYCLMVVGVAVLAWTIGLVWFAASLPKEVSDPARKTDAIVVLTGGTGRLTTGLALLSAQRAEKLFVSGVSRGIDVEKLLSFSEYPPENLKCCIALGYEADNTRGNAIETAKWMRAQGFRSLRLVTASYHMPRSLFEFARMMPDLEIVPHPIVSANVKQEDWWRWPGSAGLLATEYSKYLIARLRGLLPGES